MDHVLVTGGAGFVGSHVVHMLLDAGIPTVIFDNFSNGPRQSIAALNTLHTNKLEVVEGNLCDHYCIESALRSYRCNAVIHCAGLKAVAESIAQPLHYYQQNIIGTLNLLAAMNDLGIHKLVFSSSATVYGMPQYLPINEAHPLGPINPYGQTKAMIEQIIEDYAHANSNFRAISLRYFNPTGAHPSGLLGENPNDTPNNLMPLILHTALGIRTKLSVFGNDYNTKDGTGVRDYIHVMDLAQGHLQALQHLDKNLGHHIINLGTGTGYSVLELIQCFEQITGTTVPYQVAGRRPGDTGSCYADPSAAHKLIGWNPKHTLEDMCRDSWNSALRQHEKKTSVSTSYGDRLSQRG